MTLTIGGKLTAGVNDTGGHIFFEIFADGGKFSTVSMMPRWQLAIGVN
jgi:hypothetical protein